MEVVECRYRGRLIGWLVEGPDGFLRYQSGEWIYRADVP